jgi:hypothetical protein
LEETLETLGGAVADAPSSQAVSRSALRAQRAASAVFFVLLNCFNAYLLRVCRCGLVDGLRPVDDLCEPSVRLPGASSRLLSR